MFNVIFCFAMSSRILNINIHKSDEGSFGFSLLGKFAGFPHVIYDVVEDSPAAYCEVRKSCTKTFFPMSRTSSMFFRHSRVING